MTGLKQAFLALWDTLTNGTHLTESEQQMIQQLRTLGTTDDQHQAIAWLIATGAEAPLIRTYGMITARQALTTESINTLAHNHGIHRTDNR